MSMWQVSDHLTGESEFNVGPFSLHVYPVHHWFDWCVYGDQGYPVYVDGKPAEGKQALTLDAARAEASARLKALLTEWASKL